MKAGLFVLIYLLGGFLFLSLGGWGLSFILPISPVLISVILGISWFVGGIFVWEKVGIKD